MKTQLRPPVSRTDHSQGRPDASIVLLEFSDYQCPHCAAAHEVVKDLQAQLKGNLKFVFRDFPLANHYDAVYMAMCARAADRQNKYWEMHNLIFDNQQTFANYPFKMLAKLLDIDEVIFGADMKDPAIKIKIEKDHDSGVKSGVTKVPSFFINGHKYMQANSYYELYSALAINM